METIGFLELNSIAKGIEAADAMLKAAEVRLITACPSCPGKYHVLVTGEVAAVLASVEAGEKVATGSVVDRVVIPRVHSQVIEAIGLSSVPDQTGAVGILEYFSVTASLHGADAAVKAADVTLMEVRLGTGIGGKSFVVLTGDVSAVTEGVEAGAATAADSGLLVSRVVIPRPHPELFESLY